MSWSERINFSLEPDGTCGNHEVAPADAAQKGQDRGPVSQLARQHGVDEHTLERLEEYLLIKMDYRHEIMTLQGSHIAASFMGGCGVHVIGSCVASLL